MVKMHLNVGLFVVMRLSVLFSCLLYSFVGQAQHAVKAFDKLSPMAKLWQLSNQDAQLFPLRLDNKFPCIFWLADSTELPQNWNASQYGTVYTAWLNKQQMQECMALGSLRYLDVGGLLNAPRPLVDTSKIVSKVNQVHNGNGTAPRTGKNTVVGIVDLGFDGRHPTFMDKTGTKLRVKSWWHQNNTGGSVPQPYNYGSVYNTAADIVATRDWDGSHGTHVAGIAAGSGFTSDNLKYSGIAPDAEMVWVTLKFTNDSLSGSALGDNVVAISTILDGYKYIFDYATLAGKPATINLSWGMHTGPHDGTSLFDLATETMVGDGKILVGANGNDADNRMHVEANFDKHDTMYTWALDRSRKNFKDEEVYCDFWGVENGLFGVNVSVFDTFGNLVQETPFYLSNGAASYNKWYIVSLDSLQVTCIPNAKYAANDKPEILCILKMNNAAGKRMRIGITGNGPVHGWNSGQAYRWTSGRFENAVLGNKTDTSSYYTNGTRTYSASENGGTGKAVISAGAYVVRNDWYNWENNYKGELWRTVGEISSFSSNGPTVDLRTKPDISAPGQLVVSAYNKDELAGWQNDYVVSKTQFAGQEHVWMLASGTSMAAPHVCGIVALMLEANPTLNWEDARLILRKTAFKDNFTGTDDSSNARGWGKVNALKAVKEAAKLGNVKAVNPRDIKIFPNPATDVIYFMGLPNARIHCFDLSGKLVSEAQLDGSQEWDVSRLENGVYLLHVTLPNMQLNTKFIKQ